MKVDDLYPNPDPDSIKNIQIIFIAGPLTNRVKYKFQQLLLFL